MYNFAVKFTWDEPKRQDDEPIRIISMRKADDKEADIYYQNVGYF